MKADSLTTIGREPDKAKEKGYSVTSLLIQQTDCERKLSRDKDEEEPEDEEPKTVTTIKAMMFFVFCRTE